MADRHPQYPMMPNFNPSMLQQQQMAQQSQNQQQQQQAQDGHQSMQNFGDQTQLWSTMHQLQNQFRPNNGGGMTEMANLIQSNAMANRQQQQPFLGVPQMGGPSGAGPQQSTFHDPSNQRNSLLANGFNGIGGGNIQPTLSQNSMQARNAMMQAFNQTHNRQLNLIDMAGNQQNQHAPMAFPPRMGQNPAHPGANQVNPTDLFSPPMNSNQAMRQPSPAARPPPVSLAQTLMPNAPARPIISVDLQQKIIQVRQHIHATENSLRQLHAQRAGMQDAVFMNQAKNLQSELAKGKEMLSRFIQHGVQQQQQQAQQQQQQAQQQQQQQHQQQPPQPQNPTHGPPGGPMNQTSGGGSQPSWMQPNNPASQGPPFGQQSAQQINPQPSPSQHHAQATPTNMPMPPNRPLSTSHQPPQQPNNPLGMNRAPGPSISAAMLSLPIGQLPPPLEKERFEKAFENFIKSRSLRDPRTITVEGRSLDMHALHSVVFQEGGYQGVSHRDLWSVIAGRVGFVQFPGNGVDPPKSGPATAHQIEQIYKEFILPFDNAYITTVLEQKRKYQATMAANQLNHGPTGQPRPIPNSQQMQMIMSYADQPVEQLRANGVNEGIINFIETNRAHLQRTAMEQTNFRSSLHGTPNAAAQHAPNGMSNGMPPNRPFSASPPQNSNPMMHPNQGATNPPFVPGGMSNAVHDGTNQEHRPAVNPQQSKVMMQQFVRSNQEQLQRVTNMLNTMKNDFIQNRMHNLPPVPVPPEQRMEYNGVVEQLFRSAADLDAKLPMLFLFLKNEAWIRKVAIIIVTVQQQRQFLSSSNPRFIVSLDNLRHMLAEVQKAHEGFNNTMQMVANQNMNAAARAQMQSQQPPSLQQISTPQPHPSIPQQPIRAPPPANTSAPPPPPPAAATRLSRKPSAQPGGAASPTPPPISATTPTANAPTPSAAINAASSPKSPKAKTKAKPPAKTNRRPSKVLSTPNPEPATLPAPSPSNKRPREEDAPPATAPGATPPFMNGVANEPSPPKKLKTDWEGPSNETLKQREEQATKVETEEDASVFLEQMTELIKMAGGEGQEALSSDISDTLDILLKGYSAVSDGSTSLGERSSSGARPSSPPIPSVDEFEFFDFSSFETEAVVDEDETGSKAATPDLVSSSSTNPSPESGSEADGTHHALTFSDLKTEEPADPLRLSTMKEVDGGESAYYQSTEWKWDGPMSTLDQPWAIFQSS